MSQRTRFIRYLTPDDLVDIEFDLRLGRVVGFRVNYRAYLRDSWVEIVRYDTRHGRLHLHRFWMPPQDEVQDLEDVRHPVGDYADRFTAAVSDITRHWQDYRFLREAALLD